MIRPPAGSSDAVSLGAYWVASSGAAGSFQDPGHVQNGQPSPPRINVTRATRGGPEPVLTALRLLAMSTAYAIPAHSNIATIQVGQKIPIAPPLAPIGASAGEICRPMMAKF